MQPLKRISQLTGTISADKLDQAHLNLKQALTKVKELAETFDTIGSGNYLSRRSRCRYFFTAAKSYF